MKKLNKKGRFSLEIFLVLLMLVQIILPIATGFVHADKVEEPAVQEKQIYEEEVSEDSEEEVIEKKIDVELSGGKDLGNIFNSVKLTVKNGDEEVKVEEGENNLIEIQDGTVVNLEFEWEIPDDVNLEAGDWAVINIPDAFMPQRNIDTGNLYFDGEVVGEYTLTKETNKLKVIFNDKLKDLKERRGEVEFALKFDLDEFLDDSSQTIKFEYPIDKEFSITLKPIGDTSLISKTGKPNAEINASSITWTIDINTSLDEIDKAVIIDKIPEGLKLHESSIEVYNLTVGYEGKITVGDMINNINSEITENELKIGLGKINSAYRIKYTTTIEDYSKAPYTNEATIFDGEDELDSGTFTIDKIDRGSLIEKSGEANKELNPDKITWAIDVNKSEQDLKNVTVDDILEDNRLTIDNISIKIFELNKEGNQWVQGTDVTDKFKGEGELAFPIELGDINKEAYRIKFDTDIDYGEEYNKNIEFKNRAILKEDNKEADEAEGTVNVERDSLLEKSGKATIDYETKEIKWTIHVNEANHSINNAVITDVIGEGLELKTDSIKIYDHNGEELPIVEEGFPRIDKENKTSFTIELGDIDTAYKIEYITTITDYDKKEFSNKVSLKGDGLSGDGITNYEIIKEPVANATIENKYFKSRFDDSDGIDYENKTMSWMITIRPIKEKITELTITDTSPNNGLVFLPDTLEVKKPGQEEPLEKDTHYTIEPKDGGYENGFILKFKEGYVLEGADYYIYYDTSFDPDYENIVSNETYKYINKAEFTGKTKDKNGEEHEIEAGNEVSYNINDMAFNGGKKDGVLDRDSRKINWKLYVNYMSQDLTGKEFVIEDTFSEGQELDEDSITVKEYSVNKDGTIKEGEILGKENYEIKPIDNGFRLTFENGIDKPYLIEYITNIIGISKEKYSNEAKVSSGDEYEKTYEEKVIYPEHDKFIVKEGIGVENNQVFTDDEINWEVTLNESLSDIENAKFEDIISSGHIYINDSLKIYKGSITDENIVNKEDYTLNIEQLDSGDVKLEIDLGSIDSVYIITYDTVVIAEDGEVVKNTASFSGEDIENIESVTREFSVTQTSSGTGSGVNRGSIKIEKVDSDSKEPLVAGFELYYLLNGEERLIKVNEETTHFTNEEGVLEFTDLPLRTYYLREVEAPEGYLIDETEHEIEISKEKKDINIFIENEKITLINIVGRKEWVGGPEEKPGIELQLYRNDKELGDPVTLENGVVEYTWKDLYKTDKLGEEYKYTIKELNVPENYESEIDGFTVTNRNIEKIDIPVEKKWIGPEAKKVVIKLLADGEEQDSLTLTAEDNWEGEFKGLFKYNQETGEEIKYIIEEVEIENYESKVEENEHGFVVTNRWIEPSKEPEKPEKVDKPKEGPKPDKGSKVLGMLPKTGEGKNILLYLIGLFLIPLGIIIRKRK